MEREHALPDLEPVHTLPQGEHLAAGFESGDEGVVGRIGIEPLAREHIGEIHARGLVLEEDLPRPRHGIRSFFEAEVLRRSGAAEKYGAHDQATPARSRNARASTRPRISSRTRLTSWNDFPEGSSMDQASTLRPRYSQSA